MQSPTLGVSNPCKVIQTMATSMAGLEGTTVGDFRLVGNGQMRTLEGLGKTLAGAAENGDVFCSNATAKLS